jgi:hypothetical protein
VNEKELLEQLTNEIGESLRSFIGRKHTSYIKETIELTIASQLERFRQRFGITSIIPRIDVKVSKCDRTATVFFYDPETGEEIDISKWKINFYGR